MTRIFPPSATSAPSKRFSKRTRSPAAAGSPPGENSDERQALPSRASSPSPRTFLLFQPAGVDSGQVEELVALVRDDARLADATRELERFPSRSVASVPDHLAERPEIPETPRRAEIGAMDEQVRDAELVAQGDDWFRRGGQVRVDQHGGAVPHFFDELGVERLVDLVADQDPAARHVRNDVDWPFGPTRYQRIRGERSDVVRDWLDLPQVDRKAGSRSHATAQEPEHRRHVASEHQLSGPASPPHVERTRKNAGNRSRHDD